MSLTALTLVWEKSRADHGSLLIMLAISDNMNEESGVAWVGIDTIARKSRLSIRNVIDILPKLEKIGELSIQRQAGPKGTHLYRLGPNYDGAQVPWPKRSTTTPGGEVGAGAVSSGAILGGKRVAKLHPNRIEPDSTSSSKRRSLRSSRGSGAVSSTTTATNPCPVCGGIGDHLPVVYPEGEVDSCPVLLERVPQAVAVLRYGRMKNP
jgi:hypothetical protein